MLRFENPIDTKFEELRSERESALIAYLTGGDPDTRSFIANSKAIVDAGADILEIGMPFSDPIADGPIIQASSNRALLQVTTLDRIFYATQRLATTCKVPIVLLTYYNPILAMGIEDFLSRARRAGINGLVIPDLPVGEEDYFSEVAMSKYGIDKICLVAPNTSALRLQRIIRQSKGFLYFISLYGVTGPRDHISPHALEALRQLKKLSNSSIPLCAGFGVSKPEQVRSLVNSGADGVIVGSALVRIVAANLDKPERALDELKHAVRSFKNATSRSSM